MRRRIYILRILGAVITASCGATAAYLLNARAKQGLVQAEAAISLVRFLRSEIECFSMPLPRALARCPKETLKACGYNAEKPPESIRELLLYVSDGATREQLCRFGEELGRGYTEEQLALCDYYTEMLEDRRRQLAEQLPVRRKMYSALCMSGALAVVILLF